MRLNGPSVDLKIDTRADRILRSNSIASHSPRIEFFNPAPWKHNHSARVAKLFRRYSSRDAIKANEWEINRALMYVVQMNSLTQMSRHPRRCRVAVATTAIVYLAVAYPPSDCSIYLETCSRWRIDQKSAVNYNRMLISITITTRPASEQHETESIVYCFSRTHTGNGANCTSTR